MANVFLRDDEAREVARPFNFIRPISASATRIDLTKKSDVEQISKRRMSNTWQDEAWDYADAIGEVKYAFNLVGNVTSRCRLYPATVKNFAQTPAQIKDDDPDLPEGIKDAAVRAMRRLESANGGQAALLRDAAINLSITGECFLVQTPPDDILGEETWDIKSVSEVLVDAQKRVKIKSSASMQDNQAKSLPEKAFVGRIWRQHPRYSSEADSSLRGLLDLMNELLLLNRAFRSTIRSRLNSGVFYIPDSIHGSGSTDSEPVYDPDTGSTSGGPEEEQDELENEIIDAMVTPITDEESASAVVPLILRGPIEASEALKHIKFERAFDQNHAQRSDRVLERILMGLDVPKDVVSGLAQVRYSNAIVIDQALYKAHIEPLVVMICDALTYIYLRPVLKAEGFADEAIKKMVVWYDPAEIVTRPDRAQDANDGHDRWVVSGQAWRAAHGFSEEDAPTDEEMMWRIMKEKGDILPELSEAIMAWLYPKIMEQIRGANAAAGGSQLPPEVQSALMDNAAGAPPAPNAPPEAQNGNGNGQAPPPGQLQPFNPATPAPPPEPAPQGPPA